MELSKEDKELYKKMGDNLATIRGDKTQDEIATVIGMKTTNYNTIEAKKGERHLKDFQLIKLAKHYNTSTDFLLGLTNIQTADLETKAICNKYGLTEKSLSALKRINQMKKDFNGEFTTIDTINRLLEEIEEKKFMCIIQYIDYFLNLRINPNKELVIGLDDDICIWDKTKDNRIMGRKNINNETLIKSILIEIEDLLIKQRNIIQREGEKNECKRIRKK